MFALLLALMMNTPGDAAILRLVREEYLARVRVSAPRKDLYIPQAPTGKQADFVSLDCKEALYGGAAGGGKSSALLMAALQHVDIPNYSAIIFRRTFQDLSLPDALIPRSHEWLGGTDARWDSVTHTWHFPSGATLAFGYMDSALDQYRYQGAAFQFIGWDELTQFEEEKYRYMFSRLRALGTMNIPLRVRGASNPGGIGHRWVKRRFIDPRWKDPTAIYVPARLSDNPYLREDYKDSLAYLDDVTKARYLEGDWTVVEDNRFVYATFDTSIHMKEIPLPFERGMMKDVIAGVDPGTRDPYAVVVLVKDWDGVWWAVDEVYETGMSTARLMPTFHALHKKWGIRKWYVDKRKPSDIMDLIDGKLPAVANIDVHGENERDTIRPMIGVVNDVLHDGRFFVSERCESTIKELESYMYRDAEDRNAGEVPIDKDNHACDALRYGICSVEDLAEDRRQRRRSGPDMKPRPVGASPRDPRKPFVMPSAAEYFQAMNEKMDRAAQQGRRQR